MNSESAIKRIAIIGCGYVGRALGETLAAAGHDVIGTTTTPARVAEIEAAGITPQIIELSQAEPLHALLGDRDAVFLTVAAGRGRRDYAEVYLNGVKNLLRAAEGTAVRRIIYTSSTQVYGQDDGSWVDESSPTQPQSQNGRILLEAEHALLAGVAELTGDASVRATVVRLGGIHGPGRDLNKRILAAAGQARADGNAFVNLIHRDDIVAALVRLLEVGFEGALNLTDGAPVTRKELYDQVIASAGLPPIRWEASDTSAGLGKRVRNDLARKTLLVTPQPFRADVRAG